jgi:hypothetical protein
VKKINAIRITEITKQKRKTLLELPINGRIILKSILEEQFGYGCR